MMASSMGEFCLFCGKSDHNFVNILQNEDLKHKVEVCLPITVTKGCTLPQICCRVCVGDINSYYGFVNSCLDNISNLETDAELNTFNFESCLKINRKKDVNIYVEPIDLPIKLLKIPEIVPFTLPVHHTLEKLVDYDSFSESEDEIVIKPVNNNLIDEIVERKNLKRKNTSFGQNEPSKIAKMDLSTVSRRKKNPPKKIYQKSDPIPENPSNPSKPENCLLCDKQFQTFVDLANHIFEIHGLDFTQIYANDAPPKKKLPELVKISDLNLGKLGSKLTIELVEPNKEPEEPNRAEDSLEIIATPNETKPTPPATMSSLNDSLFICNECPTRRNFTNFPEFSTHRRAQHSIFHCDLCPKFYGRNSHLWKHVNRVHKGHTSVTCSECGKTSASEYHLQQHRNKMHSNLNIAQKTEKNATSATEKTYIATVAKETIPLATVAKETVSIATVAKEPKTVAKQAKRAIKAEFPENDEILSDVELSDDENDILNRKFEGFDFNSVKQSFLRQELLDKRERYVNILKKNNILSDDTKRDNLPPKEIDASSDLYTTIITNYSRPTNDGPYKCPKCHKGFHKKSLLKKHKKNCRPKLQKDLLTRCKTCSRIFKDRQSLSKHLTNYHSKYSCELCSITVSSKCEIISHIRFSHPNCDLKCEHCGQILRNQQELQFHKTNLQNSFICTYCGDSLTTKIRLKMHILSLHRKILSLSCGICLKLFESQYILRNHVKLAHFNQLKKFVSCTICGKNYGTRWKTLDHINKSHGRIFKACKVCLEVFETEKELEKHLQVEHAAHSKTVDSADKKEDAQQAVESAQQQTVEGVEHAQHAHEHAQQKTIEHPNECAEQQTNERGAQLDAQLDAQLFFDEAHIKQETFDDLDDEYEPYTKNKTQSKLEKRLLGQNNASEMEQNDVKDTKDDIFQNSSKRTVYINSNSPSRCEICLKVWPAKKHLWQHLIRCHKQTAATVCGICLKTNVSYSALERHLKTTHPNLLHGQGFGSNFICKICGRYHNASSKLRLHMAIHVGYTGPQITETEPEMELDNLENHENLLQSQNQNQTLLESENSDSEAEQEVTSESEAEQINEETPIKNEFEDDNYYESLIEEVEASSEEENENVTGGEESDLNNPEDMEKEMLKNMIGECRSLVKSEPFDSSEENDDNHMDDEDDSNSIEIKHEYIKSDSPDEISHLKVESDSDETDGVEISSSGDETVGDELDSAVRSISTMQETMEQQSVAMDTQTDDETDEEEETDEEDETDEEQEVEEVVEEEVREEEDEKFKRIHRVNESELETAVGSIL